MGGVQAGQGRCREEQAGQEGFREGKESTGRAGRVWGGAGRTGKVWEGAGRAGKAWGGAGRAGRVQASQGGADRSGKAQAGWGGHRQALAAFQPFLHVPGHSVRCEYTAHKEGVLREELLLAGHGPSHIKVTVQARVMGKGLWGGGSGVPHCPLATSPRPSHSSQLSQFGRGSVPAEQC